MIPSRTLQPRRLRIDRSPHQEHVNMTTAQRILLLVSLAPTTVLAGAIAVPEPGVLSLVGLGVAVAIALAIRKRR